MKYKISLIFTLSFSLFLFSQQETNKLNKAADSIIQNLDKLQTNQERISNLTGFAGKYRYVTDTKKLLDKALEISTDLNQKEFLAQSYYSLGNYYYFNSELDSALIYNEKANDYLKDGDFHFLQAKILNSKGTIYRKKGNVVLAISTMLESKNLMDKIDTLTFTEAEKYQFKGQNLVLNNSLANFYNQMEDYEKAFIYYDNAYEAALKLNAIVNAGVIISNKGESFLNSGHINEAISASERGKELKIEGKAHPRLIANSDLKIGLAYSKNGEYVKALQFLNNAHDYYVDNQLDGKLALALNYRGELFLEQKDYLNAKSDCESSKKLAKEQSDLEAYMNACNCLYKTNKQLNLIEASLINHEDYLKAKDSLFNEKNIKKQTQLEMEYAFKVEQDLQKLEAEKNEKQRKLYLSFAIIGLIIASLLTFLYSKNRSKSKLLATQKNLLEKTVGEKNMLLKETHHRVKNSFQIVSGLLFLQSSTIKDKAASKALQETQNRINSMAVLHQKLYKQDHTSGIDCKDYITALMTDILSSYSLPNIEKKLMVEPIIMDIEVVTSLGLIINELVTNSLKYAFSDEQTNSYIEISLKKNNDDVVLEVIDNGNGISEGSDKKDTLGLSLVRDLSEKINGKISFESLQNTDPKGTKVSIVLNESDIL
ncbi:tetratricopeptide repeat-containing sensor histidine kinase [Psychroserpens ponticola]|uniref:histidine kinase n=1 Tax=Psychroserpens ponticola TaxID=2932268 RepID=A0ABY7RXG5_9FLAO|nr:histidine kinase dimerization/phosphoacceptor domain -containing protein [Psychroserpens ponticola]WCO01400.1 ATP-binding protein [Psychroserpens ponticola]